MVRHRPVAIACKAAIASALVASAAFAAEPAAPDPRRGEEVGQICFARSIDGFRTLKGVDDAVLLERGVNDWYFVELIGMCSESQLRFAQSVAIVSRPSGGCLTTGDTLIFSDSAFFNDRPIERNRCTVRRIYKWDEKAPVPDEAKPGESAPKTE
jgi:hypothetical protein